MEYRNVTMIEPRQLVMTLALASLWWEGGWGCVVCALASLWRGMCCVVCVLRLALHCAQKAAVDPT